MASNVPSVMIYFNDTTQ